MTCGQWPSYAATCLDQYFTDMCPVIQRSLGSRPCDSEGGWSVARIGEIRILIGRVQHREETPTFERESISFRWMWAVSASNQTPAARVPQHNMVAEVYIHSWSGGLSREAEFDHLSYQEYQVVAILHLWWICDIHHISRNPVKRRWW